MVKVTVRTFIMLKKELFYINSVLFYSSKNPYNGFLW